MVDTAKVLCPNLTPVSDAAKVAGAIKVWVPPTQTPTSTPGVPYEHDYVTCEVLLKWIEMPEIFQVHAVWQCTESNPSGCFDYDLFGENHESLCTPEDRGIHILGWRYTDVAEGAEL
jgi:hypothetical protein